MSDDHPEAPQVTIFDAYNLADQVSSRPAG
jgi:hypothetical protein